MRVEEIITDRIVKLLEAGTPPWHKPWTVRGVAPTNAISKGPYSGINVLMLASQAYASPYWLTFKQAKEANGSVKRGEHGSIVVFAKRETKEVETDKGLEEKTYTVLRDYTVFNVEQTELQSDVARTAKTRGPRTNRAVRSGLSQHAELPGAPARFSIPPVSSLLRQV